MSRQRTHQTPKSTASEGAFWLYGLHAARAAPRQSPPQGAQSAVLSERARPRSSLGPALARAKVSNITQVEPRTISRGCCRPEQSIQGVALVCEPLPELDLVEALSGAPGPRLVVVLDQITDPHNEGAILRSAAAFEVAAVIVQDRHAPAPPRSGALAEGRYLRRPRPHPANRRRQHRARPRRVGPARLLSHRACRRRRRQPSRRRAEGRCRDRSRR